MKKLKRLAETCLRHASARQPSFFATEAGLPSRSSERLCYLSAHSPPTLRYGAAVFALRRAPSEEWWLGAELNRRHKDFQSSALPTELPSRRGWTLNPAFDPLAS